jgi:hypothetical protein
MSESADRRAAQDLIIQEILARGGSYAEAGAAANVSTRTVRRRMTEERFANEVALLRSERVGQLLGELVELSTRSIQTIRECLEDESASIRLRAADLTLTHMSKLRREHDVDVRLGLIEAKLDGDATLAGGDAS